jgi:hypothetical protein
MSRTRQLECRGASPRELERAVQALGARVAVEDLVVAGGLRERFRQLDGRPIGEQVRRVAEPAHLMRHDAAEPPRRMAERVHGDAAREVEIAAPAGIHAHAPRP